MSSLSEEVNKMRADFCEGCKDQFSREEILSGQKCAGCEKAAEVGRLVAGLQD